MELTSYVLLVIIFKGRGLIKMSNKVSYLTKISNKNSYSLHELSIRDDKVSSRMGKRRSSQTNSISHAQGVSSLSQKRKLKTNNAGT